MTFVHHRLEKDEEVQVGAREINFVQHIGEIISLDSSGGQCDVDHAGPARPGGTISIDGLAR